MSRADEPTTLPDGDDEITTDVDPSWVASIRADTNGSATSHSEEQAHPADRDDVDDWVLAEPRWDPEATVGVSDGLIERIRQEVRATPTRPVTSAAPTTTTVPATTTATTSAVPAHDVTPAPSPVDVPSAAPARPAPPPPILEQPRPAASATGASVREGPAAVAAPAPIAPAGPSVDDLASTTVRWEPRQPLAATAPIADTSLIAPPTHHGLDKTKVVIALIVAVALVIVVWLVVSSLGSDDPAPSVGSVPATDGTVGTGDTELPGVSTPVDVEAPVEVGG